MTRSISFSGMPAGKQCAGTHGMAYSKVNGHIYATCSGAGGLAEINPGPDPATQSTWDVVQVYQGLAGEAGGGQVYESADERFLVLINKGDDKAHLVEPQATGAVSTRMFPDISVPGALDSGLISTVSHGQLGAMPPHARRGRAMLFLGFTLVTS